VPLALLLLAVGGTGIVLRPMCFCRAGEQANRAKCANNLRQIALASILYSGENGGRFPDTLDQVLLTQEITADVFVCPSSADERATGPTTQAVAANLTAGHHLSYVYVGKGLTDRTATADTVLLYEAASNHGGSGMNVVFGDAHVQWYDAQAAAKIIAELNAGHNPPRPEKLR
jgi:prepilin-type processing-associated H-X9-DG protein